tara:strand:+ start:6832 stop:7137 length:306 start_codon:yes stop_codon:yes gene_type:complete
VEIAEPDAWTAIGMMAVATLLTRLGGAVVMARVGSSPRIERFLEAMSSFVLAAIVATALDQVGPREALAAAVAGILMRKLKGPLVPMGAGMACAALWTALS